MNMIGNISNHNFKLSSSSRTAILHLNALITHHKSDNKLQEYSEPDSKLRKLQVTKFCSSEQKINFAKVIGEIKALVSCQEKWDFFMWKMDGSKATTFINDEGQVKTIQSR